MSRTPAAPLLALVLAAACAESVPVGPVDVSPLTPAGAVAMARKTDDPTTPPTGERWKGQTALIPIFDWDSGNLIYGSTPIGPALWPAKPNPNAQAQFYLVVYPITTTVPSLQCFDFPFETCPDHGPTIAGGAMQLNPAVYGNGVLGHNHLSPPHGKEFHVTEYPVLVLFTSAAAANQALTTKAAVEAAAARGEVFLAPFTAFSFHNSIINQSMYDNATPWICPAFTFCERP
jgi:hypothetical protein